MKAVSGGLQRRFDEEDVLQVARAATGKIAPSRDELRAAYLAMKRHHTAAARDVRMEVPLDAVMGTGREPTVKSTLDLVQDLESFDRVLKWVASILEPAEMAAYMLARGGTPRPEIAKAFGWTDERVKWLVETAKGKLSDAFLDLPV